jgi:phosphate ABC transporter phosphate-binding protein
MSRLIRAALAASIVALVVMGAAGPASADGPTILGAGSTWSEIAIRQWASDVSRLGVSVNYQGVGSTQGRQLFAGGTLDFAATEIPYQPEDAYPKRKFAYLPDVAGGTSLMYNLVTPDHQQIRSVTLSPSTIALIFTGKITNWNDKRIRADDNPDMPDLPIRLVVRSDGSGTSAQFTRFLHETVPSIWNAFTKACHVSTPPDGISFYPYGRPGCLQNAIGAKGSDGVSNYIANPGLGVGAIGYVEAAYAISRKLPVVGVKNRSGNYSLPTAQNVATALQHAQLAANSTQDLSQVYTAPEAFAYPISSYSYMVVPTEQLDPARGAVLGAFINYFACAGQRVAAPLGYSPMPPRLVQFALSAEQKIPGAPNPPAINASQCQNPTVTGDFKLGSSVASDNVLPYTDLGQKTYGSSQTQANNSTSTSNGNTTVTDPNGTGNTTVTDPNGNSSGPGAIDPASVAGYVPDTLSAQSLKPLKAAALEKIASLDDSGKMPLVIGAVIVLAVVLTPALLRFRR